MRWWCRSQKVGVAIILDSRESKIDGSACVDRIIGAGRDMRTIWDVSAQRDNEEAEAGQGVGQPTSIGHLGLSDTFGTQPPPTPTRARRQ